MQQANDLHKPTQFTPPGTSEAPSKNTYRPKVMSLKMLPIQDMLIWGGQVGLCNAACRGNCYTKKAGNIGLVLRRAVVQGLMVMGDDDFDVCCSGTDAPPKVGVFLCIWGNGDLCL